MRPKVLEVLADVGDRKVWQVCWLIEYGFRCRKECALKRVFAAITQGVRITDSRDRQWSAPFDGVPNTPDRRSS
jgi:hypothetical protein